MLDLLRALLSPLDPSSFSSSFNSDSDSSSSSYSYSYSNNSKTTPYAYVLAQLAPLLVLLGLPALALLARAHWAALVRLSYMVLEALLGVAIPLPWGWGGGNGSGNGNGGKRGEEKAEEKRSRRKERDKEKGWRMRRSQNGVDGELTDKDSEAEEGEEDLFYPGLVNISGTYCFLNSVLQATASLAYLQPHIDAIHARAVELDVPTPVVDTLQETLQALNTPKSSRSSFRPVPMINALSQPVPGTRGRSKLFASREHQDAQELFQLLSECIKSEAQAVDAEAQRDRGLGAFASSSSSRSTDDGEVELSATGVFDGLTANRRSCVTCGYTEAVMHFAFATWSLALPAAGYGGACSLQECLAEYTRLELLTDCVCRRCSMRATHARLREEAERLVEATRPGGPSSASQYKKKKAKEAKRLEKHVAAAIEAGRIEEDVKGVKMERVVSSASTKQAMIARPPKILVLHLNRSLHFGGAYSSRNPIRVRFPEILDLTPYTTSGQLSTAPSSPISAPPPVVSVPRCTTPTQGLYATPRVLYRLSAVVVHYGTHSFGHYVCFRRKPRVSSQSSASSVSSSMAHPTVPQMPCPYGCDCTLCTTYGPVRDFDPNSNSPESRRPPRPGRGWLRISDDAVEECGLERVLAEGTGAFLLFYERVQSAHVPRLHAEGRLGLGLGSIYQHLQMRGTPRSSEETVRPADVLSVEAEEREASVSVSSSLSSSGEREREKETLVRPRVVRRTTAGRRERSREGEDTSKSKPRSSPKEKEKKKGAEEAVEAVEPGLSGESAYKKDGDGVANGSAVSGSGSGSGSGSEAEAEVDLSESIVRVELPSPPRTPSPTPSRREHPSPPSRPTSSLSASSKSRTKSQIGQDSSGERRSISSEAEPRSQLPLPCSSSSSSSSSTLNSSRLPPPPPPQAPRTPSPTPSPSPTTSPSRKAAKSRIPRPLGSTSGSSSASASASVSSSTSASVSASHSGSGNGSNILPDRAAVGLRA